MHILKKLEKNLEKIGKNLEKICPVGGMHPPIPPPWIHPWLGQLDYHLSFSARSASNWFGMAI